MSEAFLPAPRPVPAAIPPLLGFTAGFVDACTALALFGLFVAQVTGSFVLAAVAFVTNEQGAVTKVLAIPVFLLAAVVTTVLAVLVERRGRAAIAWALGLECAVLTSFLAAVLIGAPLSDPNAVVVVVASLLGLFAMGTQSATVRLLMRRVASTNVMTTNTTQIAIDATELVLAWQAGRHAPAPMLRSRPPTPRRGRGSPICFRSCSASCSAPLPAPLPTLRPERGAWSCRSRSCGAFSPGRARDERAG